MILIFRIEDTVGRSEDEAMRSVLVDDGWNTCISLLDLVFLEIRKRVHLTLKRLDDYSCNQWVMR
jgi:hypothetical protein